MKLIVKGKNVPVTKAIKEYAEKKFSKLDDFFEKIIEATLEIKVDKGARFDKHKAHIIIKLPKHTIIKGEARTENMYATIDELAAKMSMVIKRQHEKFKQHNAHETNNLIRSLVNKLTPHHTPLEEEPIEVVLDKKMTTKPMDPVEAVLQLSKTKLKFYPFYNTKVHHQLNVIYERPDGSYGLQTDKKQYIKRAKLSKFKNKPLQEQRVTQVKITKIKEINKKELTLEKAVHTLMKKKDFNFLPFVNKDNGKQSIVYKVSVNKVKVIEPTKD